MIMIMAELVEYITLASAYMGRAGFSLYDIVNSFIVEEDENDDGAFANYTKNVISHNILMVQC
jgi:hypothetical protein